MSWRHPGERPAPGPRFPRGRSRPPSGAGPQGPGVACEQGERPRTPEARSSPNALVPALGAFFRLSPLEGIDFHYSSVSHISKSVLHSA
ncbi:unnamed protein product [Coccothraustes coccothraustes]